MTCSDICNFPLHVILLPFSYFSWKYFLEKYYPRVMHESPDEISLFLWLIATSGSCLVYVALISPHFSSSIFSRSWLRRSIVAVGKYMTGALNFYSRQDQVGVMTIWEIDSLSKSWVLIEKLVWLYNLMCDCRRSILKVKVVLLISFNAQL